MVKSARSALLINKIRKNSLIRHSTFFFPIPSPEGEGMLVNQIMRGEPALFLMKYFRVHQSFEVRKFIGHMRQLHGFHKILLEGFLHRQLDVFHIA